MNKVTGVVLSIILSIAGISFASENDPGVLALNSGSSDPYSSDPELLELMDILDKQTTIATKTRLNIDYVPGNVEVFYGQELAAQGIQNVWEALSLMPGIELGMDLVGNEQVLVRGWGSNVHSGNLKILLNGQSMNSSLFGMANTVMNMPIEQIHRVDIIRGPGSALYGEYAYSGVVDVITKKKGQQIHAMLGKNKGMGVGGHFTIPIENFKGNLSLNFVSSKTDGANIPAGPDLLYSEPIGLAALSNAPGPSNEKKEYRSLIMGLNFEKSSINYQYVHEGHGDHFGTFAFLPPDEKRIVITNTTQSLSFLHSHQLSKTLSADLSFSLINSKYHSHDANLIPAGVLPGFQYDEGNTWSQHYQENRYDAGLHLHWTGIEQHKILTVLSVSKIDVTDSILKTNFDYETGISTADTQYYTEAPFWVPNDTKRNILSLTLQDEWRPTPEITVTSGLRYDRYSDTKSSISPRFAVAFELSEEQILKFQYAKAFRPSTFFELVTNHNLKSETIQSVDVSYIFKQPDSKYTATLFHAKLADISSLNTIFSNTGDAETYGIELAIEKKILPDLKIDANLTYIDNSNVTTNQQNAHAANWLGNLSLFYTTHNDIVVNTRLQYVGDRGRDDEDSRSSLDRYIVASLTASIDKAIDDGVFTLHVGVKNLFNEDIRYPSSQRFNALVYPEDYPRPGRQWWLKASYSF